MEAFVSQGVVTTAMCIAEYMTDCDEGSSFDTYVKAFDDGAWELRGKLSDFAKSIESAFEKLGDEKRSNFQNDFLPAPCWDYSVVPWLCEKATETGEFDVDTETIINWVEEALLQ
jgi:hypothetical protein